MTTMKPHRLTDDQVAFYHAHGYLLVRGALSEATLALSQRVLERWVEQTIGVWVDQGLLRNPHADLPFERRLLEAWREAGNPQYHRSPRRDLVSPEMFDILRAPELLDVAEALLGTPEISLHSSFNARPKLPDQRWTDTPWHQDAQYFRDAEHTHVPTFWFPLQRVTTHNSCLQVQPDCHRGELFAGHNDADTGFIGLAPEVCKTLSGMPIEMERGDLLCFSQLTPHAALPNRSDNIRWSMDSRYEDSDHATPRGRELGFIARSRRAPDSVTTYETWLAKWRDRPAGTY